jgi:hypothetical protein
MTITQRQNGFQEKAELGLVQKALPIVNHESKQPVEVRHWLRKEGSRVPREHRKQLWPCPRLKSPVYPTPSPVVTIYSREDVLVDAPCGHEYRAVPSRLAKRWMPDRQFYEFNDFISNAPPVPNGDVPLLELKGSGHSIRAAGNHVFSFFARAVGGAVYNSVTHSIEEVTESRLVAALAALS